uniref:Uncharacterized protein n=1 Tax=Plectus sambesii TaxID=2011161 RepID=A0A914X7I8_9BILA
MSKEETSIESDVASIFDRTETAHWTEIVAELKSKAANGMIKDIEPIKQNGIFKENEPKKQNGILKEIEPRKQNGIIEENEPKKQNGILKNIIVSMETVEKSSSEWDEGDDSEEESESQSEMLDLEDPRNDDILSVHDEEYEEQEEHEDEENQEQEREKKFDENGDTEGGIKVAEYEKDLATTPPFDAYESHQEDIIYIIYDGQPPANEETEQSASNNPENKPDDFCSHPEKGDKNEEKEREIDIKRKEVSRADLRSNEALRQENENKLEVGDDSEAKKKGSVVSATSRGSSKNRRAPKKLLELTRMSAETRKFIVQIMDKDEREQVFRSCFDGNVPPGNASESLRDYGGGSLVEIIDQRTGRPAVLNREDFIAIVEAIPVEKKLPEGMYCDDVERALNSALQSTVGEEDRTEFLQPEIKYDFLIDPRMKNTLDGAFDDALDNILTMSLEAAQNEDTIIESYIPLPEVPLRTPEALRRARIYPPGRTPPVYKEHSDKTEGHSETLREPPPAPGWLESSGLSPSRNKNRSLSFGEVQMESGRSSIIAIKSARSDAFEKTKPNDNHEKAPDSHANDL